MVRKTSSIRSIGELNDKKVITVLNTTGEKNLRYFAPEAIVQGYRTYEDGFKALQNKQAEAMTADEAQLRPGLYKGNGQFRVPVHLSFRKDGTLNRLKHKWIPTSFENETKMKKLLNETPRYKGKFNKI